MEKILLEDVSFTYPGKETPTLNQINISGDFLVKNGDIIKGII